MCAHTIYTIYKKINNKALKFLVIGSRRLVRKLGMVTINLDLPCLTWRDLPAGVMFPCYTMFLGSVVCVFSRLLETFVGQKSTGEKKMQALSIIKYSHFI